MPSEIVNVLDVEVTDAVIDMISGTGIHEIDELIRLIITQDMKITKRITLTVSGQSLSTLEIGIDQ